MIRLFLFLKRYLRTLLFVLFELCAIYVYANSTSYAQARMLSFSNTCIGVIVNGISGIKYYFSLKEENQQLVKQLEELNNSMPANSLAEKQDDAPMTDTSDATVKPYYYTSAKVIRNTINRQDNYFIIDKGRRDGIEPDMAIVTTYSEAVGYVMECSNKFSVCMSLLNSKFSLGGILKNKDYFGFLKWEGEDYRHILLNDIPVYADIAKGDTILSTISFRFPPDIIIGTVADFKVADNATNYDIKLNLSADFGRLNNVFVIKYHDAQELKQIEKKIGEFEKQ